MTTRRWMLAVAGLAFVSAGIRLASTACERSVAAENRAGLASLLRINGSTMKEIRAKARSGAVRRSHDAAIARHSQLSDYYSALATLYRAAAHRPWLPIAPDPSPPE